MRYVILSRELVMTEYKIKKESWFILFGKVCLA
jgi:hypothetical protein